MLTPEETAEIKKLFAKNYSKFSIAAETQHSYKTVDKYVSKFQEELQSVTTQPQIEMPENIVMMPFELGFLTELVMEKVIGPAYKVYMPLDLETAGEFIKIEKLFKTLEPMVDETAKAFKEQMEKESGNEDSSDSEE